MSKCVVERIVSRIHFALGITDAMTDRWESGSAQQQLKAEAGRGISVGAEQQTAPIRNHNAGHAHTHREARTFRLAASVTFVQELPCRAC